jgi:hypothetical protein
MSTITTRAGKGSPLTNTEVDTNFTNLNTDKLETSGGTLTGNLTISSGGTPQLTLYDSGNGGGGGATHRIDFENTSGVSTAILIDSSDTTNSDLVITNNHASGYVDDDGISDATSDIVLYPLTHVRIASGDLQMGSTTVIDSSRNATFQTLKIESNVVSTTSDIALTANAAINAVNSMSFGMTEDTSGYFRWMFGNDSNIGGTAGGVEKMKLNHNGNLTLAGTVDGVDIAAFKTAYDSHMHPFTDITSTGLLSNNDLDDYTSRELLHWGSSNPANSPAAYGAMFVIPDGSQAQQLVQTYGGAANKVSLYGRRRTNSTWDTSWTQYFSDHYHPNADKWTTARTLTLTGDVTGSVTWDGSAPVSMDTTVVSAPSLLVSHVPTSAQSGIIYPAIIEAKDSGNVNDYVLDDGVGIQFKIGTNPDGSPSEYSQVGASIAAIRESTTDISSNTGLGLFISQNNETLDEALRIDNVGNADFKLGTLKMGGTALVTQDRDVTPRKVNIVSSENDALKLNITDDVANRSRNAMHIDFNLSGADATTADRTKVALRIDLDSTATGGDTNHEHRVYGIINDVRASGDSDIIYGQYNYVEPHLSSGTTSVVYGDYSIVTVDESGSGRTTTATGTYGYVNITSSGTGGETANAYGGYFRALCGGTQEKNITNMHGIMAEVEIDNSANGVTVDNAYVVRSYYDNDVVSTGDVVVTNTYLYHGAYAGTLPNNPFGVYISSDVPNYFRGNVDVRGSNGLEVKNASDTHLRVQLQTELASDYGILRFYGKDSVQVGFLIGYGSSHGSTPDELVVKATAADGKFAVYTNGQRRLRVENTLTTVTTPMVVNPVTDVSFTSTGHAFQIGAVGGANMRFDTNEIMCINADATSHDLRLQHSGGRVLVNNDLILEGHRISTNGVNLDFSVDADASSSNQSIRFFEGGVLRMQLEDNDLYVQDNINAGYMVATSGNATQYDTGAATVNCRTAALVDGSTGAYRTYIQSYNSTDPDLGMFVAHSKDVMADTGVTSESHQSTAHVLDNGGRHFLWNSVYAGRSRAGTTSGTNAYRAGDNVVVAYSGTGNAHGATASAGSTAIYGRETANGDDVFLVATGGQHRIEFDADGNGRFDGGADISAADYAEYFEWVDGNPDNEDRRGRSVVLTTAGKMRIATSEDDTADFLGIVSVEAAVVGDSAWAAWTGKCERDRFGQKVYEDYELLCWGPYDEDTKSYKTQTTRQAMIDDGREADIPEDAITVVKQRQKLAADYDPGREYIARKDRPEWQAIGLMGKLPLLKGQPTAPQWRKLFDLNDEVEMWLVR